MPLPSRELLESVHQFPCEFVFKAVGRADDGFVAGVVAIVREVLEQDSDPPFQTRETPAGRHVAVTVVPWVQTADEVLLIFARIQQVPGLVLMM